MDESRRDTLTLERMRADIAAILDEPAESVGDDDNLIDLGLDSIRAMTLLHRWTAEGDDVDFSAFAEKPTLGHWWKLISLSRS